MKKLHLICNAHLDPVWQWTSDEGMAAAIATFQSAVNLAHEFDYIFCHNEALLYEAVEHDAPDLFEKIKELVRQGKWQIIGGWYLQPDCNMPSGESFIRQIQTGRAYFEKHFGVKPTTAVNFDSFGHSIGLVQILQKCGYDSYLITRPFGNAFDYPGRFFEWVAPNGSKVIVGRTNGYNSLMGHVTEKIKGHSQNAEDVDYVLWGVGNHGGGPSRKDLKDIEELQIPGTQVFHSTPERLFADDIRISGKVTTSLLTSMPGCYTSMHRIKEAHREAESLMFYAEKLMTVAALSGCHFDEAEMKRAQKKLLLAQFHDILPGSSVPDGEKEGLELLHYASNVFRENRKRAFLYLAMGEEKAQEGEYPIFVFNPLPYEITCPVEAEFTLADQNWDASTVSKPHIWQDGKELKVQQIKENSTLNLDWRKRIVFEGKLKPMALTRFSVKTVLEKKKEIRHGDESIQELFTQNPLLQGEAGLLMYEDTADPWGMSDSELTQLGHSPKNFIPMTNEEAEEFCKAPGLKPVHVTEDGEVFTAVEKFYKFGYTRACLEYRFYKNQPYTDLKVTLEFAEKNRLVRLKLPIGGGTLIGDGPYVVEEKGNNEVPFQKWLGKKQGEETVSVINNGIYGGLGTPDGVELTLIRGTGYLFHPINDLPLYPTDRYLPRIDCGRYTYDFRIFKGSVGEVSRMAELFNGLPYAVNAFPVASGKKETDIHTDKPVCMPVVKYENGKITARIFNPEKTPQSFQLFIGGNRSPVTVAPYEVISVRYQNGEFSVSADSLLD